MDAITFRYVFSIPDRPQYEIPIEIDSQTLNLVDRSDRQLDPWTELSHHQCPNCPLDPAEVKYCPIAANISSVIVQFQDGLSCEATHVTAIAPERTYSKETDLQQGLNSIFGLIMASSGCPHFQWLKPLARFHLPFASFDETLFRAMSSCALSELIKHKTVRDIDEIYQLVRHRYEQLAIVNAALVKRIGHIGKGEADRNALVTFHSYCQMFNLSLSGELFTETITEVFSFLSAPTDS
ncbi:MAG: hypothetical protein AAGM36_13625 [Cyanobacteria bacterium J06597_1]